MSKFVMKKKCVECGAIVLIKKNIWNISDKKFKCGYCKIKNKEVIEIKEYCDKCSFPLMANEKDSCNICKIKSGMKI